MDGAGDRAFRRRVVYIPGYDPFPARRYRELYRREGAAQAALSGYDLTVTATPGAGWRAEMASGEHRSEATFAVLGWADIVKASMKGGVGASYLALARTAWTYLRSGALGRLARLRKGPVLAVLYPVGMLMGQLALALLLPWALLGLLPWPGAGPVPWPLRLAATLGTAWGLLRWFLRHDGRVMAHYLMRDYAFSARWGGAYPPALEARLADWHRTLAEAMASDADEVLVVGHSSGAYLAASLVADLLRGGAAGPALGLLTLGQVIPMVSFLPRAGRLRADLAFLSTRGDLTWVDVTAPGDGCAFALCDPVAVSGVRPDGARWPLVISAAFTRTLSATRWAALRRRYFRLHFQYLCAFDALPGTPGDYDYFAITAGPLPLARRFAGRRPTPSRIDTPLSPHVSVAA